MKAFGTTYLGAFDHNSVIGSLTVLSFDCIELFFNSFESLVECIVNLLKSEEIGLVDK